MHDDKFTKGMRGEFRGDFTRDTFDPMRNFSRVLMQQGRVQVDADWNEQVSILLHYMRQIGRDLMGPHGAPYPDDAPEGGNQTQQLKKLKDKSENFKIILSTSTDNKVNFSISPGCYYVNGIRCENSNEITFRDQKGFPFMSDDEKLSREYLVYLDAWERHLTYVEDDYMREKALGGADTASRAQIVWQVKVTKNQNNVAKGTAYSEFLTALPSYRKDEQKPQLKSRARKASEQDNEPCLTAPEASYRGAENQLYRVEIHNEGEVGEATFKWSRENGSVIFPIAEEIDGKTVILEHLGRDDRFSLQPGDWIEVLDDDVILRNKANQLLQVTAIDRENFKVTLGDAPESGVGQDLKKHPYLRRWDHKKDMSATELAIPFTEPDNKNEWITLENGIQIQFQALSSTGEDSPVQELSGNC